MRRRWESKWVEFDSTILICGKKWDGVGSVDFSKGEGKSGGRDGERDCTILIPQNTKIPTHIPFLPPLSSTSPHISPLSFPFPYSHHTSHPISSLIFLLLLSSLSFLFHFIFLSFFLFFFFLKFLFWFLTPFP